MALPYDCERILATIEWATATMRQHGCTSGYAMDAVLARDVQLTRAESRQGLFARYLRGDNVPRWQTQIDLLRGADCLSYPSLPLFDVLRIGLAGSNEREGATRIQLALDDLQGRFERRITRYDGPGQMVVSPEPTRRFGLELSAYGSCHAVTVLLVAAIDLAHESEYDTLHSTDVGRPTRRCTALHMGQRAYQCLMFAFANGEFPVTAPLLAARVRQRILDGLRVDGQALDTAAVDLGIAVATASDVLREAQAQHASRHKQRAFVRAWLKSSESRVRLVTPGICGPEVAEASRADAPVPLRLRASTDNEGGSRKLGKRARRTLAEALVGYAVESIEMDGLSKAQDGSGARYATELENAAASFTASI